MKMLSFAGRLIAANQLMPATLLVGDDNDDDDDDGLKPTAFSTDYNTALWL